VDYGFKFECKDIQYDWSHRAKARQIGMHVQAALVRVDPEFNDERLTSLMVGGDRGLGVRSS
jgi:hypothetical protein